MRISDWSSDVCSSDLLGAEILLHLADETAGEGAQVRHLQRVVRRDDEPKMVAIIFAALGKFLRVEVIAARAEQPGLLPIPGNALAAQIAEMGRGRGDRKSTRLNSSH